MSTKYEKTLHKSYKEELNKKLKIIEKDKKEIQKLLDMLIDNTQFNINRRKLTKHFPLSKSIEENASLEIKDDEIIITYNNIVSSKKISFISESNLNYSFTFSEYTYEQHLEYIKNQLQIFINQRDLCITNLNKFINDIGDYILNYKKVSTSFCSSIFYKNVKNNYVSNDGRYMYKLAYNVNILPPNGGLLYDSKNNKFMICNCYTIALNNENKWNIFFDYDHDFVSRHNDLIRKFNQIDNKKLKSINYVFSLQDIGKIFSANNCYAINEQTFFGFQNNLGDDIIPIPDDVNIMDIENRNKIEKKFKDEIFKNVDFTYKTYYYDMYN